MKTIQQIIDDPNGRWVIVQGGLALYLDHGYEIRLEPLLFGACYLAVYKNEELIADKIPVTLDTPARNNLRRTEPEEA